MNKTFYLLQNKTQLTSQTAATSENKSITKIIIT